MWSFDVFDTCLIRRQACPSDLFLTLAEEFQECLLPFFGADFREIFREARVESERQALAKSHSEETTLIDIWQELQVLIPVLAIQDGITKELQVEHDSLLACAESLARVTEARSRYGKVVFISDTYLPLDFVQEQLITHGFFRPGDICFTSSAFGATKRSGKLFEIVINTLGLSPGQLTHHGDDKNSDVEKPNFHGIRSVQISTAKLTDSERRIGGKLKHLDAKISSQIIGSMRASRVAVTGESDEAQQLVSSFIGPFLWCLADWVLTSAIKDGRTTLYFCSRDCHALYHVANTLVKRRQLPIDCKYLLVSRQALLLPSITEFSPEGMPWLKRPWEDPKLKYLISKLDLDLAYFLNSMNNFVGKTNYNADSLLIDHEDWKIFWSCLNTEPLRSKLVDRVTERYTSCVAYLKQEGLLGHPTAGVVDLGWTQSCLAALSTIAKRAAPESDIKGYFLGLISGRGKNIKDVSATALFHSAPRDNLATFGQAAIFMNAQILEHLLSCSPSGTVNHYFNDPATDTVHAVHFPTTEQEIFAKKSLLREARRFAELFAQPLYLKESEYRSILDALCVEAISNPCETWISIISDLTIADNHINLDSQSIAPPLTLRSVFVAAIFGIEGTAFKTSLRTKWLPSSILRSHIALRTIFSLSIFFRKAIVILRKKIQMHSR